ncbi:O-antigen ligase family protein [Paenibacillus larvae]
MNDSLARQTVWPSWHRLFLWLMMPLSAVVFIEPAPYDVFVIIALLVAAMFSFISFSRSLGPSIFLLALFVLCNVLPALIEAKQQMLAVKYFAITLYLMFSWLFFTGILNRYKEQALNIILSGYMTGALFSAVLGILAYFHLIPTFDILIKYGRATGLFKDPNVYGPFLVPAVGIALYRSEQSKGIVKTGYLLACLLAALGVLLSFSRAAWGNCALASGIYLLLPQKKARGKRFVTLALLLLLGMPVLTQIIQTPAVNHLFVDRLGLKQYDNNRFGTQKEALEETMDHPFGIGPGQSEKVFDYATHSLYVRVLTEYGIAGSLCFFLFIALSLGRAYVLAMDRNGPYQGDYVLFAALLTGVLFNSFFVDTLHWRHFWLLLALPWIPNPAGASLRWKRGRS